MPGFFRRRSLGDKRRSLYGVEPEVVVYPVSVWGETVCGPHGLAPAAGAHAVAADLRNFADVGECVEAEAEADIGGDDSTVRLLRKK